MNRFLFSILFVLFTFSSSFSQNALSFDGINDFIQTDFQGIIGSADRTFEAWIFYKDGYNDNIAIMDYGLSGNGTRNTFGISQNNGSLQITGGGDGSNIESADNEIASDEWVHVAFVLKDQVGFFYKNGVEIFSQQMPNLMTPEGGTSVRIGQRVQGNNAFDGIIDELRIWDVARTEEEIADNMNQEICNTNENLVLYLRLNEGFPGADNSEIDSVVDDSGNNHDSFFIGFALMGETSNWVDGSGISVGASTTIQSVAACASYIWELNNMTYTESGNYTEVISEGGMNGCDSVIILNLTIIDPSIVVTDEVVACNSFTWIDGITYTEDISDLEFTTTSNLGCDSTVMLDLTILTVNSNVIIDNNFLLAEETDATYQWLECPGFNPVEGETEQGFTVIETGEYAVAVTQGMCTDTSDCIGVTIVNNLETEFHQAIAIYPNPSNGDYNINMGKVYNDIELTIKNINGQNVQTINYDQQQFIQLNINHPAGMYLVELKSGNNTSVQRIIKL